MQLRLATVAGLLALASSALGGSPAQAQVTVSTTNTVYREAGGGLETTSVTPSLRIKGTIRDRVTLRAGWEADVVSGASVAVVDAPGAVDAITSATEWSDFRNTATAGFGIKSDFATLEGSYTYGTESDYRSHAFSLTATAQLFERNTTFALTYGRGFDKVCNLAQPRAQEAVDRSRMPSSDGCFGDGGDREELDLALHTLRGAWTQAWAPIFVTQLTLSAQILNGYQGNPYRAVWLGRTAAQENHPLNRARYAAGLGLRFWVDPLAGALQLFGRLYRDTWDIASITAEAAWEQRVFEGFTIRGRVRYYNQSAAAFYSDDYLRFPRGQYFTGDRELSPMSSWLFGGQVAYAVPAGEDGSVGPFAAFTILAKFDWVLYDFRDFRYGNVAVPNDRALMATLGLEAGF